VFGKESSLAQLDVWVNLKMLSIQSVALTDFFVAITHFFGPVNLIVVGLALACFLMWKKRIHQALVLSFGLLGGAFFQAFIKELVERVRPENALIVESGFSFPSGHATMAVIFFCALLYVFSGKIKSRIKRDIFGVLCLLLFVLVGFSRVYLNVHWVSDVIAGFAFGTFWLTALILFFKFTSTALEGQETALSQEVKEAVS
jgi:undecaprenyl-diphosphatase